MQQSAAPAIDWSPLVWSYATSVPRPATAGLPQPTAERRGQQQEGAAAVNVSDGARGGARHLQRPATAVPATKSGKELTTFSAHLGTFPNAGLQGMGVGAFELPASNETFDLKGLMSTRLYGISEENRRRRQKRATSAAFRRQAPGAVMTAADANVMWMFST